MWTLSSHWEYKAKIATLSRPLRARGSSAVERRYHEKRKQRGMNSSHFVSPKLEVMQPPVLNMLESSARDAKPSRNIYSLHMRQVTSNTGQLIGLYPEHDAAQLQWSLLVARRAT